MPITKINDIHLYYEIHGEGKPLMIIWGISGEICSFVDYLKNNTDNKYQLIFFDNRGAGRTDKIDGPYSFEIMAQDVIGLLDELGIGSVHLIGISMGSRIALLMASKYPDRVDSLILNVAAARSHHNEDPESAISYEKLHAAIGQPEFLKTMGDYSPTVESFICQFEELKNFDVRRFMDDILAPTLIVNGTKDVSTPVKFAEELSEGIFGSQMILVEADHLFIRTQPELLMNPVFEFLEEIDFKPDSIV